MDLNGRSLQPSQPLLIILMAQFINNKIQNGLKCGEHYSWLQYPVRNITAYSSSSRYRYRKYNPFLILD